MSPLCGSNSLSDKGTKDEVKQARRAKTLKSWPGGPSRLLVLGIYVKPVHCRIEWTEISKKVLLHKKLPSVLIKVPQLWIFYVVRYSLNLAKASRSNLFSSGKSAGKEMESRGQEVHLPVCAITGTHQRLLSVQFFLLQFFYILLGITHI